jgi:hypothetical protein
MKGNIGQPEMASSRLRTYPGKPRKNDSRSTAAGWLQRDSIADAHKNLSRGHQSVISVGETLAITVAKGEGNRPNLSVQTQHLARAERLPDPANAGIVKPAGARHRGLYER